MKTEIALSTATQFATLGHAERAAALRALVALRVPRLAAARRVPLALVIALDRSASMSGEPFRLALDAVQYVVEHLQVSAVPIRPN